MSDLRNIQSLFGIIEYISYIFKYYNIRKTLDEPHVRTYPSKYPYVKNICPYLSNLELARLIAKKSCRNDFYHVGMIKIMSEWFLSCRNDFYHVGMIFFVSQRYGTRHVHIKILQAMYDTILRYYLFTITPNLTELTHDGGRSRSRFCLRPKPAPPHLRLHWSASTRGSLPPPCPRRHNIPASAFNINRDTASLLHRHGPVDSSTKLNTTRM
jgi:hypothetical protein